MKTKSFKDYAEKRLGKEGVAEVKAEALGELEDMGKDHLNASWDDVKSLPNNIVIHEFDYDLSDFLNENKINNLNISNPILNCFIFKGEWGLFAYIGVDSNCKLAEKEYDTLNFDVNGGLTFAGRRENRPDYFYYGWDYCHIWDKSFNDELNDHYAFPTNPLAIKVEIEKAIEDVKCWIKTFNT